MRSVPGANRGAGRWGASAQSVGRRGEQVEVVGGEERADDVERAGLEGGEISLAVVALVEGQVMDSDRVPP